MVETALVDGSREAAPGWRSSLGRLGSQQARALDARASGLVDALAGLVMLAAAPLVPSIALLALTGLSALLVAALAWSTPPSAPAWRCHLHTALAMPIMVLGTAAAEHHTALRLGPVVLAVPLLTIACVRPRREVVPQLVWSVVAYGVFLVLTLPPAAALVGWMAGSAAGAMITLLVCHLRVAVDDLVEELRAAAHRDPLTGLANRLALRAWVDERASGTRASGGQIAVLVVDVDHFKRVNDTFGHSAGDLALVGVAEVLSSTCARGELAVRLGGEEFALCLLIGPEQTDLSAGSPADLHAAPLAAPLANPLATPLATPLAIERAQQVRAAVKRHFSTGQHPITVSVGVAVDADVGVLELLARADEALYTAKRLGRDRVHVAGRPQLREPDGGSPRPARLERSRLDPGQMQP